MGEQKPYWIVINENRGPASYPYKHATQQQACDEALRLCRLHGGNFIVFEAQFSVRRNDVVMSRLSDGIDIPF